ncbi:MAG TPA: hypothetical protein VJH22_04610, partial [Candidatus Nanoarchaeia archaeon]|nr:hypothetical protein [Candidatus Nanoarchaeia archaeon]
LLREAIAPVSSESIAQISSRFPADSPESHRETLERSNRHMYFLQLVHLDAADGYASDSVVSRMRRESDTGYLLALLGAAVRRDDLIREGMAAYASELERRPIHSDDIRQVPTLLDYAATTDDDALMASALEMQQRFGQPYCSIPGLFPYSPDLDALAEIPWIRINRQQGHVEIDQQCYNLENFHPEVTAPHPALLRLFEERDAHNRQFYEFIVTGQVAGAPDQTQGWRQLVAEGRYLSSAFNFQAGFGVEISPENAGSDRVRSILEQDLGIHETGVLYATYRNPEALESLRSYLFERVPELHPEFLRAIGARDMRDLSPFQALKITSYVGRHLLRTGGFDNEADNMPIDQIIDASESWFGEPVRGCCRHISAVNYLIAETLKAGQHGSQLQGLFSTFRYAPSHVYNQFTFVNHEGVHITALDGNVVVISFEADLPFDVQRPSATLDDRTTETWVSGESQRIPR